MKTKILKIQIHTDLHELSKDWGAGLHDTAGLLKALDRLRVKALELEAHEDAVSDIEDSEVEMRSEREAIKMSDETDYTASPEDKEVLDYTSKEEELKN